MLIRVSTDTLHRTKAHQYAVRFAFGGAITVFAGIIARKFGPGVGGLFLAFPAIFPAAATLAQKHEKEKKQEHGMPGKQRGILTAADQARGCAIGSIGLSVFAILMWKLLPALSLAAVFSISVFAWFAISSGLWFGKKRVHLLRKHRAKTSSTALQTPASDEVPDRRPAS